MDAFDLSIIINKLKIINEFDFLVTLKALETYIDITGFFRNYIFYYV